MPSGSSPKRERQYGHVKESALERGYEEDAAEELAARTVNKARARSGEAKTVSRSSIDDISSGRRGGLRSHGGPKGPTRAQLYGEARRRNIKGRSSMNKAELQTALGRVRTSVAPSDDTRDQRPRSDGTSGPEAKVARRARVGLTAEVRGSHT